MKKIALILVAAAMFAGSGMFAPRPAQADTNSTIAIAAAAIVGLLTFDALDRPYYVDNGVRCYVPDDVADYYFQNYYGGWYDPHRNDWWNNRRQFIADWNGYRGYNGGGYGYQTYAPPAYNGYRGGDRSYDTNYNRGYNNGYNGGYNRSYNTGYTRTYNNPAYNRNYDRDNHGNGGNDRHGWSGGRGRDGDHGH